MTLRKKTVLILCISAVLMVALIIAASRGILFQRYVELEKENLSLNARRLESVFMAQMDRFSSYVRDWAVWDSAYDYVRKRPARFLRKRQDAAFDARLRSHAGHRALRPLAARRFHCLLRQRAKPQPP